MRVLRTNVETGRAARLHSHRPGCADLCLARSHAQRDEAQPDEDVVAAHRVVARVGEHQRAGKTVLGLELRVRLHPIGLGVRAVALEVDGLRSPVDAVIPFPTRRPAPR